jgi:hypothetical protein
MTMRARRDKERCHLSSGRCGARRADGRLIPSGVLSRGGRTVVDEMAARADAVGAPDGKQCVLTLDRL